MYESFWQLQRKPFENTDEASFYFPSESHQAAILKLRYAIENRRTAALLAGPSGSGKTLVVQRLRQLIDARHTPFAHLVFPQMPCDQLLAYLAGELDGSQAIHGREGVAESVRRIENALRAQQQQDAHAVVVIDEAQLIEEPEIWEALRLLTNIESAGQAGLTLVLVGQTGLLPTVEGMPALDERLGVKCLLRPFGPEETAQYVAHRLKAAGATREIFAAEALATLHRLTCGTPRQINRLCDLALLIGFAEQRRTVTAAQFEAIAEELVAVVPE